MLLSPLAVVVAPPSGPGGCCFFLRSSALLRLPLRSLRKGSPFIHFRYSAAGTYTLLGSATATGKVGSPAEMKGAIEERNVHPREEEEEVEDSGFVEVGYICGVHGLDGELRVKPTTGFPQLRFSNPGRRWLRARVSGKEKIQQVELVSGTEGRKGWIISLSGIDTVDKAKQIVGSTMLVQETDRPELEIGEFYNPDLVGIKVVLKENGAPIGTVVNVFNYGANDLLQVSLDACEEIPKLSNQSKPEVDARGSLVWIPFVEAIVPDVDINKRVMQITPPKGLLELNLRSDLRSKKERSQLEWKQRKKFQQRVIAAKKKLIEMEQKHVLQGFSFGDKDKKNMLAICIVDINFKLFQHVVKNIDATCDRLNLLEFLKSDSIRSNFLKVSQKYPITPSSDGKEDQQAELQKWGLNLLCDGKVAIVLVASRCSNQFGNQTGSGSSGKSASLLLLQELLEDENFMKINGKQIAAPLVILAPACEVQFYQELFTENDYFGFDNEKVWFLKEANLPVIADKTTGRILLKSPWEILQSPVGSGGVFSLLSSHKIVHNLINSGVEYVQVCSLTKRSAVRHSLFHGLVKSKGSDVGIKIFGESHEEGEFDLILSMKYINEIIKHEDKLHFSAVSEQNEHVELVDNEWISIIPSGPNSLSFQSSIFSVLSTCASDNVSVLQIID